MIMKKESVFGNVHYSAPRTRAWLLAPTRGLGRAFFSSFKSVYLLFILRERERERECAGEGQREREREDPKQAPSTELNTGLELTIDW